MNNAAKPRLWQWSFKVPGIDVNVRYWIVWVVALLVGTLLGWSFSDGWGSNQWGPIASWVSGIGTLVAVGVALFQTKLARDDAKLAKLEAGAQIERDEKRHTDQLKSANERLVDELNAQRRARQVEALYHAYRDEQVLEAVYDAIFVAIKEAVGINNRSHPRQQKVDDIIKQIRGYRTQYRASMAESNFIVSDTPSRRVLNKIQEAEEALNTATEHLYSEITSKFSINSDELDDAKKQIQEVATLRGDLIDTARTLSDVIPLNAIDQDPPNPSRSAPFG